MNRDFTITVVVVFNHNYETFIEFLEKFYLKKFDEVFFIMPFYSGNKANVIPVFGNSFYFGSYIAQASKFLLENTSSDFLLFVADDLFLNPVVTKDNFLEIFKLNKESGYIPRLSTLKDHKTYWSHARNARDWDPKIRGIEISELLPKNHETFEKLSKFGSPSLEVSCRSIYPDISYDQFKLHSGNLKQILKYMFSSLLGKFFLVLGKSNFKSSLPFYWSYSDIFIVPREDFRVFSNYLGMFSATNLFVEIAIPTSLALSVKHIVTDLDLEYCGKASWPDFRGRFLELEKYGFNFEYLMENYPKSQLYIHPIKLSRWELGNEK